MIKYLLGCASGHEFDSWFRAIDDYEAQSRSGMIACPVCGSRDIAKRPMAPSVVTRPQMTLFREFARFRKHVVENSEDVGRNFAEEARKMHFGEIGHRGIRGESTAEEVRSLLEDGIDFGILPPAPEDLN